MNDTMQSRPAVETFAHFLMLRVLNCKNANDRLSLQFTMKRPDAAHLLPACDWALERGFLKHGTTNASARVWNRFQGEQLYMTKAGKAWLRANDLGRGDWGSSRLFDEIRAIQSASAALAV